MQIFPSLMMGITTALQGKLRTAASWADKKSAFTQHFAMDKAVVLADLHSMSVQNWDVEAYTIKFNKVAACLAMAPGDKLLIK